MKKILFVIFLIGILLFFIAVFFKLPLFRRVYFLVNRKIAQATCKGPNKMYTTIGFSGSPFCADVFNDGGKSCDSGSECSSGICYLDFYRRKELIETQFGREAFYRGNSDFSLILPPINLGQVAGGAAKF